MSLIVWYFLAIDDPSPGGVRPVELRDMAVPPSPGGVRPAEENSRDMVPEMAVPPSPGGVRPVGERDMVPE